MRPELACQTGTVGANRQAKMKLLDGLAEKANANETIRRLGRFCTTEFVIEIGDVPHHVVVDAGRIRDILTGPFKMRAWSFAIRAPEASWIEFWKAEPRPGYQDIFAMAACGHARIEGDLRPLKHNLRFIKEVLAVPREGV